MPELYDVKSFGDKSLPIFHIHPDSIYEYETQQTPNVKFTKGCNLKNFRESANYVYDTKHKPTELP